MIHRLPTAIPLALSITVLAAAPLMAQDEEAPPLEAPPMVEDAAPPPMPRDDREGLEPEVTIIRQQDRTIEEYRINGQLYMIKVTPSKGYPYYLVDADGDGNLETRRNELDPRILVPSWVIFRW
jgi:hypothetical protein